MREHDTASAIRTRRPVNVTLPDALVVEAKSLRVTVSHACEKGLAEEVGRARAQTWLAENKAALDAWDDYFETHGLPLARYRQF